MTKIEDKKAVQPAPEKVRQSELGMFLKLVEEDKPIEEFESLIDLADRVSQDFNVECTAFDLETFFNLDEDLTDEAFEVESRKQQFYGGYNNV